MLRGFFLRLAAILLAASLFVGCKVIQQTISHDRTDVTTIDTVWQTIEIGVPVYIYDTTEVTKTTVIYESDSSAIDSLQLLLAIRDAKLRNIVYELHNKTFSIDTIYAENLYAKSFAYVTNNKLSLDLLSKPIDTIVRYIPDSIMVLHTKRFVTDITNNQTTIDKSDTFASNVRNGLSSLVMFALGALFALAFLKIRSKL